MIDRQAIYILYNDQVGKKLVEHFYQLLVVYSQNEKIKPVESYLLKLNDIARKKKTRLVYYDNHSLKRRSVTIYCRRVSSFKNGTKMRQI